MYVVAFIRQKLILLTLDAHDCGIRKIIITTVVLSFSLPLSLPRSVTSSTPPSHVCTRNRANVSEIPDLCKLTLSVYSDFGQKNGNFIFRVFSAS